MDGTNTFQIISSPGGEYIGFYLKKAVSKLRSKYFSDQDDGIDEDDDEDCQDDEDDDHDDDDDDDFFLFEER